jgi:putative nucleotidyltransferase with HDIG domain
MDRPMRYTAETRTGPDVSAMGRWSGGTVLVVDDEAGVRDLMRRWLADGGYEVASAADADQALGLMERVPTAVALCDIRMPGHDGLWLADRIRRGYPDTAVIMATGVQDVAHAVESLRCGVVDYLTKPFGRDRLREAVGRGVEWHRTACDRRRWRESLAQELRAEHARLGEAISALPIESDEAVDALLSMLTINQRAAYEHAYRVAAMAVSMARAMGLDAAEITIVERGALLHDLGKLALPEALLRKPAPLTRDEQDLVRLHPSLGSDLVERVPYLAPAAAVVRDAHERLDGRGFPRGSRDDEVWLGARIVAVADAFDTMTRPRVFRDALGEVQALEEIERCSGTQFDPRVVEAFKATIFPPLGRQGGM